MIASKLLMDFRTQWKIKGKLDFIIVCLLTCKLCYNYQNYFKRVLNKQNCHNKLQQNSNFEEKSFNSIFFMSFFVAAIQTNLEFKFN